MAYASLEELDQRIAIVRDNIRELTEQAAAFPARRTRRAPQTGSPARSSSLRSFSSNASSSSIARGKPRP